MAASDTLTGGPVSRRRSFLPRPDSRRFFPPDAELPPDIFLFFSVSPFSIPAFLASPPHSAEVMLLDYPLSELVRGVFYGGKDEAVHEAVDVYNGGLFDEYLGELLVPNND